jgi:hypothetical protein
MGRGLHPLNQTQNLPANQVLLRLFCPKNQYKKSQSKGSFGCIKSLLSYRISDFRHGRETV